MVSSRSSTMRLDSVARFPLMTASWSNSAFVLMEERETERETEGGSQTQKSGKKGNENRKMSHIGDGKTQSKRGTIKK